MKHSIALALIFVSVQAFGQKNKLSLVAQLQPELTFPKSDYYNSPPVNNDGSTSVSLGFNASLQYKITSRLFIDGGLGFISRRLKVAVSIDYSKMPPPYFDSGGPALYTRYVAYRTVEIPVGIGYNFFRTKKVDVFAKLGFSANFLLNTKYKHGSMYPAFKKNYWQGHSITVGGGFDYRLSKKIKLTNSLVYSVANTVKPDAYINQQKELTHTFLQLSTGIKMSLH
jgi:hypothetical protein